MLKSLKGKRGNGGFTLVELLIVIIVIGVLVTLAFIGYHGIQDQARRTKVKADLTQLKDAVVIARQKARMPLGKMLEGKVVYNYAVMYSCVSKPNGTDLAKLPRSDMCWTEYMNALKVISDASGVDVTGLTDPYGRPYYIDPNEGEPGYPACIGEATGMFTYPFKSAYEHYPNTTVGIPPYDTACTYTE